MARERTDRVVVRGGWAPHLGAANGQQAGACREGQGTCSQPRLGIFLAPPAPNARLFSQCEVFLRTMVRHECRNRAGRPAAHSGRCVCVKAVNRFGFGLTGSNQLVPQS